MRDAPANVVHVAATAVIHRIFRSGASMLDQPLEQVHARILLFDQSMAEHVRQRQRAKRADRVDEQRMRAVERADEAAARNARPPARLHGTADFQRQLVEVLFPVARVDPPLAREAPQVAVRADVVEAVIVDARVGEVRGHPFERQ